MNSRKMGAGRWLLALLLVSIGVSGTLMLADQTVRAEQGHIYYVKDDANGGDGSGWADAFDTLQDALDAAGAGDEIWIAAGTYQPTEEITAGGQTFKTFQLKSGVEVYGGFAGNETAIEERDWTAHQTILDGNYSTVHVIYNAGVDASAVLDGVTVTRGLSVQENDGTGMYNEDSSPAIRNVVIAGNYLVIGRGAGMFNLRSHPTLSNVTIMDNVLDNGGGIGMYNDASSPILTNVMMKNNYNSASSSTQGGGMYNGNGSSPTLVNVTFDSNLSWNGGGMYNDNSSPILSNVTFSYNAAKDNGGGIYNLNSDPKLETVALSNNNANNGHGGGMYNDGSSPTMDDVTISSNSASRGQGGGLYQTNGSNPVIAASSISGNSAASGAGIYNDSSNPSLEQTELSGNASTQGGGMYNENSRPVLKEVQFNENYAQGNGGGMYNHASDPTLEQVTFDNNKATGGTSNDGGGGGIYNNESSPTLDRVVFTGNSTSGNGAGMFNDAQSHPSLIRVEINGSTAMKKGGGIYNRQSSEPSLTDSEISFNYAVNGGGGIYNDKSSPALKNVEFKENSAHDYGAGIVNYNGSSPTLEVVKIVGNRTVTSAGGMYNEDSSPILRNVQISGNRSDSKGSGILNVRSDPVLTHVTVSGNMATIGSGMQNDQSNPVISNSVIWGNIDYYGIEKNIDNQNNSHPDIAGSLVGPADKRGPDGIDLNFTAADLFVDAKPSSSAPTVDGDYRLRNGSPAIDAGDDLYAAGLTTDLAGQPRKVRSVDSGAYEHQVQVDAIGSAVTALQNEALADGVANAAIKVQVKDSDGAPFAKVRVSLVQDAASHSVIDPAPGVTDANGEIMFGVSNTYIESVAFRAFVGGEEIGQPVAVQFVAGSLSASKSTVNADLSSVLADGQEAATITVKVASESGHPIANQAVDLIADGGSSVIASSPGMSDGDGNVVFTVSDTIVESVTYTAEAGGVTLGDSVIVDFVAGDISATLSAVSADPPSVLADGQEAATVTVKVVSESGYPAANQAVDLIADGGHSVISSNPVMTDGDGNAVFTVADTMVELVTYTAHTGGVTVGGPVTVQFVAGDVSATRSTVTADPPSVLADGQQAATITVQVVGEAGHPLANQAVDLIADGGHSVISSSPGMTDGDGNAVFNVADTMIESVTYTAEAGGVTLVGSVTVQFVGGDVSATRSTVTADPSSVLADGQEAATIIVQVVSESGYPVSNQTVNLIADDGHSMISTSHRVTDGNGTAVFTVTDDMVESVTYTAIVGGMPIGTPAIVQFTAGSVSAVSSTVAASPLSVLADGISAANITVTIKDDYGHALPGHGIELHTINGQGQPVILPVSGTSNQDGQAAFTVTSATYGPFRFAATVDGTIQIDDTADVYFLVGDASDDHSTVAVDLQTVTADGVSAATVTVKVMDAYGHALKDQRVALIASGHSSIEPNTGMTDGNGEAVFTVTGTEVGNVTYEVIVNDADIGKSVSVQFVAGPISASNSSVTVDVSSVTADRTSAAAITVKVMDAYGHALPGRMIDLSGDADSDVVLVTQVSDGNGEAVFRVTSASAGNVTYTATVEGTIVAATAAVQFVTASELKATPADVALQMARNETQQLAVTVTTIERPSLNVTEDARTVYVSGDPDIATVSATGLITAKRAGETTITISYVGAVVTVAVKIDPAPVVPSEPEPEQPSSPGGAAPAPSQPANEQATVFAGRDIAPDRPEELGLEDSVILQIPAGSMNEAFRVSIERIVDPLTLQSLETKDVQRVSEVYEMLKSIPGNFEKPVTIKLKFNPGQVGSDRHPSIHYYDEDKKEWIAMGGAASGSMIETQSGHFTKFAVFAVGNEPQPVPVKAVLTDIRSHWAEADIRRAVEAGFVRGYENGTFRPNQAISHVEFTVMLSSVLKLEGNDAVLGFTDDGKIGAWARMSVAQAVRAGIVSGYDDGTFRPQAGVTRAELAVMLAKALALPTETASASGFADDADIPSWARSAVGALRELGIAAGHGGNRYDPAAPVTRAEAAVILLRLQAYMQ